MRLRFAEFAALMAAVMALGAIGVDLMLPALPDIGRQLGVGDANSRQFVISIYLIGLGLGQLVHGPIADRYGRRRALGVALVVVCLTNVAAAASTSFVLLLTLRFIAGIMAAATRTVTIAIVRDCYSGRAMARATSLVLIVFMIAPVLAPTIGQGILAIGSWRLIFWFIAAASATVLAWFLWRLPETLPPDRRNAISPARLIARWREVVTDRTSLGYLLAATALQGALFGYVTSVQQIVGDVFHRPAMLNIVFACTCVAMAGSNFLNSQLVMRFGSRLLSHVALLAMIGFSAVALGAVAAGGEGLWTFVVLQGLAMGSYGLANSNFSAMAMENMGAIAGTAASLQGFAAVTGGALVGTAIGQAFNGSTWPLHLGFLLCGLTALGIVLATERGRLFRARQPRLA